MLDDVKRFNEILKKYDDCFEEDEKKGGRIETSLLTNGDINNMPILARLSIFVGETRKLIELYKKIKEAVDKGYECVEMTDEEIKVFNMFLEIDDKGVDFYD